MAPTESRARLYQAAIDLHAGRPFALRAAALEELALANRQALSKYPAAIHAGLYALIAARAGDRDLAGQMAQDLAAHPPQRPDLSAAVLLAVVQAELAGEPGRLQQLSQDYLQVHVAAARLADQQQDSARALEALRWIDQNRSRAFAEYNGFFAAQVLNALDVNAALLRQVQLETDPGKRSELQRRLQARWAQADAALRANPADRNGGG